jgi:hypothetical protein
MAWALTGDNEPCPDGWRRPANVPTTGNNPVEIACGLVGHGNRDRPNCEPPTDDQWRRHWEKCTEEAAAADVLLFIDLPEERQCGSLIEMGCAVAAGRQVAEVRKFRKLEDAIAALKAMEAGLLRPRGGEGMSACGCASEMSPVRSHFTAVTLESTVASSCRPAGRRRGRWQARAQQDLAEAVYQPNGL